MGWHAIKINNLIFIIKSFRTIVIFFIVISITFRPICPPALFRCLLSKFLRRSLLIFIIKGIRTIVFIFIVISATFRLICPPAFFRCLLSKFLRRSLLMFIIKGFRTIVFIFIVISTTFRPICPPAFFRCLYNSGTYKELRTTGVASSDSVSHNWVQVLSIPVLLFVCRQDWTCNLLMILFRSLANQCQWPYAAFCWAHSVTFIGVASSSFVSEI